MCVGGKDPGEPEGMGPQGQQPGCPQPSSCLFLQRVPEPALGAVAPVVVNHPLVAIEGLFPHSEWFSLAITFGG